MIGPAAKLTGVLERQAEVPTLRCQALTYAAAGLPVLPCRADKAPLTLHGLNDASADPELIREWWRRWPDALVAIAVPAGYVVVDVDGADGWAALEGESLSLPATMTAITGRGEWYRHLWYRLPAGERLVNKVGLLPHVDLRGCGSYVIVPPSRSVHGQYRWLGRFDLDAIADAPEWLLVRARRSTPGAATPPEAWRELVAGVAEGERNNSVFRLAAHLLRRHVDPVVTHELIRAWNLAKCRPPLADDEVARAADSAARMERRRRGGAQ